MQWKGWTIFLTLLVLSMVGEIYFRETTRLVEAIVGVTFVILMGLYLTFQHKFNKPYK